MLSLKQYGKSLLYPLSSQRGTQFFMIVYNERLHVLYKRKIPRILDTYFWDLYDMLPQQQNLEKESKLEALHLLLIKSNKIMIKANLQETTEKLLTLRYVQQCCYFLSFSVKHNALQLPLLFSPISSCVLPLFQNVGFSSYLIRKTDQCFKIQTRRNGLNV